MPHKNKKTPNKANNPLKSAMDRAKIELLMKDGAAKADGERSWSHDMVEGMIIQNKVRRFPVKGPKSGRKGDKRYI